MERTPRAQVEAIDVDPPADTHRGRLLSAALRTVKEGVPADLTAAAIAERAGLSMEDVLAEFGDEETLWYCFALHVADKLDVGRTVPTEGTVEQRLSRLLDDFLDIVDANEGIVRAVAAVLGEPSPLGEMIRKELLARVKSLESLLSEALEKGELTGVRPELMSQSLSFQLGHLMIFWLDNRDRISRDQIRGFVRQLLKFARADSSTAGASDRPPQREAPS